ncbi:hypothetical protein ODZ83_02990 [Acaricomes phytoseiuli]|uniref:hypothetical protein n=1 Tax=Acaricomes phytoseiuli TaxID=291968 RepID=UPI002221D193|nr:hypothetical protein [Acaricomes phytoseiuli]MCW1249166.1 hypothetical protein [Acaricomes phytoseiuli]
MNQNRDAEVVLAELLKTLSEEPSSTIIVREAWVESPQSVCIVYDDNRYDLGTLGTRITFPPHARDNDPSSTGEDVAMSLIEPLGGAPADYMRPGPQGVTWLWLRGADFPALPQRPAAP